MKLRQELQKYAVDIGPAGKDNWYGYGFLAYRDLTDYPLSEDFPKQLEAASTKLAAVNKSKQLSDFDTASYTIGKLPDNPQKAELQHQLNQIQRELRIKEFPAMQGVSPDKSITIQFNRPIQPDSIHSASIFVQHNGEVVNGVTLLPGKGGRSAIVQAPKTGYTSQGTYYLYVDTTVYSPAGKALKQPTVLKFTIK